MHRSAGRPAQRETASRQRLLRWLVRCAVLAIAGGFLVDAAVVTGHDTRGLMSAGYRAVAAQNVREFECLQNRVLTRIPRHGLVYVEPSPDLVHQRLTEMATPYLRLTADRARADYELVLVLARRGGGCGAVTVGAVRTR